MDWKISWSQKFGNLSLYSSRNRRNPLLCFVPFATCTGFGSSGQYFSFPRPWLGVAFVFCTYFIGWGRGRHYVQCELTNTGQELLSFHLWFLRAPFFSNSMSRQLFLLHLLPWSPYVFASSTRTSSDTTLLPFVIKLEWKRKEIVYCPAVFDYAIDSNISVRKISNGI